MTSNILLNLLQLFANIVQQLVIIFFILISYSYITLCQDTSLLLGNKGYRNMEFFP